MISIGVRIRQRPPVQLFQPPSHLNPVLFTSIADFTIWTVDSQQGQQVASQIHDKPRGIQFIRLRACCASSGGNCFSKRREYYGTRSGCRFNKIGLTSRSLTSPQPANVLSSHFSPGAPPQVGQRTASTCFGLSSFVTQTSTYQSWSTRTVPPLDGLRPPDNGHGPILQKGADKCAIYLQTAVVADEALLLERIHKFTYPRAGGTNHLREGCLAHLQGVLRL
jgi:hypothetical protein